MICPCCGNEDKTLMESISHINTVRYVLCNVCSKTFMVKQEIKTEAIRPEKK
jgi:formate dehydrogenase maturation protein FdhE